MNKWRRVQPYMSYAEAETKAPVRGYAPDGQDKQQEIFYLMQSLHLKAEVSRIQSSRAHKSHYLKAHIRAEIKEASAQLDTELADCFGRLFA